MVGSVEDYLLTKINKEGAVHMTLIDPEKVTPESAVRTALEAQSCNTAAIMVGGSTSDSSSHLDAVTNALQDSLEIPIILFPGNHGGISKHADAIWFMSLLNSSEQYFLVGAQTKGAPIIKKLGLETLSMGYIVVGEEGSTVSAVGKAKPLPYSNPEVIAAHALTAQYFGMHFIYLEAGSGVDNPVPPHVVKAVKSVTDVPIIVGGGIRTGKQAKEIVNSGASIIVTGNVLEENNSKSKIQELISSVKTK